MKPAAWTELEPRPDEDALVRRYLPLCQYLAGRVRPASARDEALSGAMLGVLEAVRTHEEGRGESLKTRVNRLARCRMADRLRVAGALSRGEMRQRGEAPPARLSLDAVPKDLRPARPDRALAGVDLADEVRSRVLARLPNGRLRRVFALYHLGGLSMDEIALLIGRTASTVSHLLTEASLELTGDGRLLRGRKATRPRRTKVATEKQTTTSTTGTAAYR